jgi:serine/threonine protein kinase
MTLPARRKRTGHEVVGPPELVTEYFRACTYYVVFCGQGRHTMNMPLPCPDSALLHVIRRGTISPEQELEIAQHLEQCAQCRAVVEMLSLDDDSDSGTELSIGESEPLPIPLDVEAKLAELHQEAAEKDEALAAGDSLDAEYSEHTNSGPVDEFVVELCQPSAHPDSIGRIGDYDLFERIGRGGMGVVYRGRDSRLGRDVALKLLKPTLAADSLFVERFLREAQAAAGINHRNVITVHAIEFVGGIPVIVMEYVNGESLRARIRRLGPLPLSDVARLGSQIADGLAAAHDQKVTHRDVKPANILLMDETDEVRITDFGLAQAEGASRLTRSGTLLGTPRYMSPEQARGEKTSSASDLFCLGSVLYTMCVGRPPFSGKNQGEVVTAVAHAKVEEIEQIDPTLPAWLTAVIRKLHAKNPEDRFEDGRQVSSILKHPNLATENPVAVGTDDGWDDFTSPEFDANAPEFARVAAETIVEFDGVVNEALSDETGSTIRMTRRRRRWMVAAGCLLATCLLVPVVAGHFSSATDAEQSSNSTIVESLKNQADKAPVRNNTSTPKIEAGNQHGDAEPIDMRNLIPDLFVNVLPADRWYESLEEAIDAASEGSTIEIASNRSVRIRQIRIDKSLTIRPASGFTPKIVSNLDQPALDDGDALFVVKNGEFTVEGLSFECHNRPRKGGGKRHPEQARQSAIRCEGGTLKMAHCRTRMLPGVPLQVGIAADDAERVDIRGSEFFGGSAVTWYAPRAGQLHIDNCVFVGQTGLVLWCNGHLGSEVAVGRSTFANEHSLMLLVPPRDDLLAENLTARLGVIAFSMENSLVDTRQSMVLRRAVPPRGGGQQAPLLKPFELRAIKEPALIAWSGDQNIYDAPQGFRAYIAARDTVRESQSLYDDWRRLWRGNDDTSQLGEIRVDNGRESFVDSMQEARDAHSLNITRFENGKAMSPDAPPGALIRIVGPGPRYDAWRNTMRANLWREGRELP